jgi:cell shape-determining protein MreD
MSERHPRLVVLTTTIIALVLTVVPLPIWFAIVRPAFLVLTVLCCSATPAAWRSMCFRARCSANTRWRWHS